MKRVKIDDYFYNPNSLDFKSKGIRKTSSGIGSGKRFYTALDMSIIKRDAAHRKSQIKRGEVKKYGNEYISVCGCGSEGCFIHSGNDSATKERMIEWEKEQSERRKKPRISIADYNKKRYENNKII
jgi:hypothetical protein